ncbi:unnamed protein product [Mytilus coruscus]|uniref:TNFR-Cys domain-containing protein n=1 Tax=Mytilus coruscus TaxID=42192 RepID=A0A6J8ETQ4_MYTCO|nr:unnamed protein product [Mytilus coruscus]
MKVSNTIFWTICLEASCLILTAHCNGNQRGICITDRRKVCCSSFEFKNEKCTKCLVGYNSEINSACKPCTNDGSCIHDDLITGGKNDKSKRNSPDTPTTSNNGDVVIYMTCVAVGSVLVVVCGLLVKNKEAICKHKPENNSVRHMIHKLKQPTFRDGRNKKVSENLYDDINEKYMIDFDGE